MDVDTGMKPTVGYSWSNPHESGLRPPAARRGNVAAATSLSRHWAATSKQIIVGLGLCHDLRVNDTSFVDVWSDVVCPFCYLGSRMFAAALGDFEHREHVVVRHRAFELDPRSATSYDLS